MQRWGWVHVPETRWWSREWLAVAGHGGDAIEGSSVVTSCSSMALPWTLLRRWRCSHGDPDMMHKEDNSRKLWRYNSVLLRFLASTGADVMVSRGGSVEHGSSCKEEGVAWVGVAKRAGPNGPARQPVLEGTGWVEDFNPSARSSPSRPTRQLDRPKYGPARLGPLARFKKIK